MTHTWKSKHLDGGSKQEVYEFKIRLDCIENFRTKMGHLEWERKKRGMEGGKGVSNVGRKEWRNFIFHFHAGWWLKCPLYSCQGYGENYALRTSHTADERQVERALWKAIYQNLPVLLILPFLVHFWELTGLYFQNVPECTRLYILRYLYKITCNG